MSSLREPDVRDIQADLAKAVRAFAQCASAHEENGESKLAAFAPDAVTATEAMIAVSAILKAVNVQVFELGMWQSFNGR
jgi:hypothetical protein